MKASCSVLFLLTLLVAEDGLGSASGSLSPPSFLYTRIIDPYTINLQWPTPMNPPQGTRYRIGVREGSRQAPEKYVVVHGAKGIYQFRKLRPYTYYFFRIQRGDISDNYGNFTRIIWAETLETAPSAPPSNVTAYNTSSMGILVLWNQVPRAHRNGHILGYKLCYRKRSEPAQNEMCMQMYPLSMHLGGLEPFTEYAITVSAYTTIGDGPRSKPVFVWTDEFVPSQAPQIKSISSTTTTISLTWAHIPQQFVHGILRGYYIILYELPISLRRKTIIRVNSTTTSTVIRGLKRNTNYGITMAGLTRVRGHIRMGTWDPIRNISTKLGCSPPTNVRARSECPKCMTIEWNPSVVGDPGKRILGYTVTMTTTKHQKVTQEADGNSVKVEIMTLRPYTSYEITVVGRTNDGLGEYSQPITQRTEEDAPGIAPEQVTVQSTGPNSLLVKWSPVPPERVNGVLRGYHVYYNNVKNRVKRSIQQRLRTVRTVQSTGPNSLLVKWSPVPPERVNGVLRGYHVYYNNVKNRVNRSIQQRLRRRTASDARQSKSHKLRISSHARRSPSHTKGSINHARIGPNHARFLSHDRSISHARQSTRRARRSSSHAGVMHALAVNGSSLSMEITGLEPHSQYSVQVAAFTAKGNGPKSAAVIMRTDEDAPSRAPTKVEAKALSAESLKVTWNPIPSRFANGKLQGYHVIYKKKTADRKIIQNTISVNETMSSATLHGLEPETEYEMWVQAFTGIGPGPRSEKATASTLKIVPGQPQRVRVMYLTPRSVKVTWESPLKERGEVTSYMVKWKLRGPKQDNKEGDGQKIVKVNQPYHRRTKVTGLRPYSMYTFTVREESAGSWGPYSEPVDQMMPEDAPTAPLEVSVHKKEGVKLVLQWKKPESANGVIRKYVVYYTNGEGALLWEKTVDSGISGDTIYHTHTLPEETAEYKIRVQAFNSKAGQMSDVLTVQHLSDDVVGFAKSPNPYVTHLPWLIIGLAAIVLLLVAAMVFVFIRRSRRRARKNQEESIPLTPKTFGAHRPVPVPDLKKHCERFHAFDDGLFVEEYRSLNHHTLRTTFEAAHTPYNKTKNRYPNILPYDHSRVVLRVRKDSPGSDYINANFIDGYGCPQKYIAAQGPLTETIKDFWRMIWEKGCSTVVMLGDPENSLKLRTDCERYWPEHGHQEYGDIAVSMVDIVEMTDWTIRTFLVWSTDPECMDKREVTQFQYTAWPDQGVPESTASMFIFHHKFKIQLPLEQGPIVVHCGAGVGRTGTFIAIDSLLDQMVMEGQVDVYGFVAQMRTMRNFMVQTEEQYTFIYDCLRDASLCGITEIPSHELANSLLVLRENDPDVLQRRQEEFNNLPVCCSEDFERSVAYIRENIVKNRCPDVVPLDSNRLRLAITNSVPCSEYINASYIDGYNEGHAYIATQAPLENTVTDFWQMVWEQKCTAIVMLTDLTDHGQVECEQYWPIEGCVRYGKYIVTKIDEEELDDHTQRVLKLRCHGSMDSLLVYHFQYHNWPDQGLPPRLNGLVCLHEQIEKIQVAEDHGPTIVHCSDGAGRTGVFLTLAIAIDRLECEDSVDIFQTVRWLRSQRPGMVSNVEQYVCCYQAVKNYLAWRTRTSNDYCTG